MPVHDLPYRSSPLVHMCYLVSEALRGPVRSDSVPAAAPVRAHWLDRIDQWVWRSALKRREAYLAQATDLPDVERRLRELERGVGARYY